MLKVLILLLGVTSLTFAWAESVQDYCNGLYPVEGYDNEDRQIYIRECVEMYAEDFAQQSDSSAASEMAENQNHAEEMVEQHHDMENVVDQE